MRTTNNVLCRHELALQKVEENRKNIVFVYGNSLSGSIITFGTGVIIDEKGLVLTAYHVLRGKNVASKFIRFNERGRPVVKEILFEINSEKDDLSILYIGYRFKSAVKVAKNMQKSGEPVFTIGRTLINDFGKIFDKDGFLDYSDKIAFGHVLMRTRFQSLSDGLDTIMIGSDMQTLPGMSGAPVFNFNGEVVGILSRNGQMQPLRNSFTWHVEISHLKELLEKKKDLLKDLLPKK
ncbi:serine protease [Candidatus Parcubacteria bacterium]|nr:serine protease [Patescibacteria group bacterium]MBU4453355.1 serine protease [Patescibacteria group bacterium]MCG2694040.1 serine protease [Candidatus Parcubacteria bacterium]